MQQILHTGVYIFVSLIVVDTVQAVQFLASCMANSKVIDVSIAREILSVCSHLARSSEDHIPLLIRIFEGPQSQYWTVSSNRIRCHAAYNVFYE